MSKQPLAPPSGSRDFLPREALFRESVLSRVKAAFALHGFSPIDTPAFERIETLSGKYGEEGDKLIFKILKRGEKAASGEADLALRYDLTVPTMRMYAHRRGDLPRIVKRYQIGPVWRADRPGRGRFREFYQCDVDIIGSASRLADIEVLLALSAALRALDLAGFSIRLNSRHVIQGMLDAYGVPPAKAHAVTVALDKLDKIGLDGVAAELTASGLPADIVEPLGKDIADPVFDEIVRERLNNSETGQAGLAEVDEILTRARPLLDGAQIRFDPILARGLDYYTGPIFEFFAEGGAGSIAGGGRYDNLAGLFLKDSVPVCGGSLGIERIMMLLRDRDIAGEPAATVYVTVWDVDAASDALRMASALRGAGVSVDLDLEGGRIGKQMKAADSRGCRFALIQGPDEKASGAVVIKEMASGAQHTVPETEAAATVARLMEGA